jgi:DNA repair exonuclease SbcCD ATPase subunit
MRKTLYIDDETAELAEYIPRKYSVSAAFRVFLAAIVLDDSEFTKWLKADKKRKEVYLWLKDKVGGKRKIVLD